MFRFYRRLFGKVRGRGVGFFEFSGLCEGEFFFFRGLGFFLEVFVVLEKL